MVLRLQSKAEGILKFCCSVSGRTSCPATAHATHGKGTDMSVANYYSPLRPLSGFAIHLGEHLLQGPRHFGHVRLEAGLAYIGELDVGSLPKRENGGGGCLSFVADFAHLASWFWS